MARWDSVLPRPIAIRAETIKDMARADMATAVTVMATLPDTTIMGGGTACDNLRVLGTFPQAAPAGHGPGRRLALAACLGQAALRLTADSAMVVSFLSAAFSSSSVSCRVCAQSARPSCLAHAISDP